MVIAEYRAMMGIESFKPFLITGASGNVGGEVLRILRERGANGIAAGRRQEKGIVELDFLRPETYGPAVEGCAGIFLMRPPAIANTSETLNRFIDVAYAAGVSTVVFLSVEGADRLRFIPHHAVEQRLLREERDWTILRPGFFAQNLLDAYRHDIVADGRIYVPAGNGRIAFIDTRDIAAVAVECLLHPERHRHQAYTLTGPTAIDFHEVAALLTSSLRREVRYDAASTLGYVNHLLTRGLPTAQVAVQTILHLGLRFGRSERVDPTLEQLLGRPGRTIGDFVRDHAGFFDRHSFPAV